MNIIDIFGLKIGIFPMWLIIIIAGIIFIGYILFTRFKGVKKDEFKGINLKEEIKKEQEQLFSLIGIRQRNRWFRQGGYIIGEVNRYAKIPFQIIGNSKAKSVMQMTGKKDNKAVEISDNIFYGLELIKYGFMNKILALIGKGMIYFLVDKEALIEPEFNQDFVLTHNANFYNFGGWNIFSDKGQDFVSNIAFKLALENTLEGIVNNIPKNAYLELKTAKFSAKARELTKLEKEKRKAYREEYGGIEDEDESSDEKIG